MALSDAMILLLNPWWTNPAWAEADPHLVALRTAPISLAAPAFTTSIDTRQPATHIIRGPRQVGKSTGLKLLIRDLLEARPDTARSVIYLNLDLLEDQPVQELATTIMRAKDLAAAGEAPCLLLLDEVTVIPKWARAVKAVWDGGVTRHDCVVCTGSSAIDLASQQLEALPGRRQAGQDHLLLPQSFAGFARALDATIPAAPSLTIAQMLSPDGRAVIEEHHAHLPGLRRMLDRYLVFGGLPISIGAAANGEIVPSVEVQRVVWDSVSREVRKRGASDPALRALLERVIRSLASKTSWPTLAREMDMALGGRKVPPDPRSVHGYIEFLNQCYELMTIYFWKSNGGANDLSRDKKLYFADPLLQTVVRERTPGLQLDVPASVENAFALHLYRRYESANRQADGFHDPDAVHAYETHAPREIDFICGPRDQPELAEVKFQRGVSLAAALSIRRAFPGRPGFVASIDTLEFDGDVAIIPAALALWALG